MRTSSYIQTKSTTTNVSSRVTTHPPKANEVPTGRRKLLVLEKTVQAQSINLLLSMALSILVCFHTVSTEVLPSEGFT